MSGCDVGTSIFQSFSVSLSRFSNHFRSIAGFHNFSIHVPGPTPTPRVRCLRAAAKGRAPKRPGRPRRSRRRRRWPRRRAAWSMFQWRGRFREYISTYFCMFHGESMVHVCFLLWSILDVCPFVLPDKSASLSRRQLPRCQREHQLMSEYVRLYVRLNVITYVYS